MRFRTIGRALFLTIAILSPWLIWAGLEILFQFPEVNAVYFILLGLGLITWKEGLLQKLRFPQSFELGFCIVCCLIFLLGFMHSLISPMLQAEDLAAEACAPQTLQARCYTIPHDACALAWTQFEKECRDKIEADPINNKVGALLGLQIHHCTDKKFDATFKTSRKLDCN